MPATGRRIEGLWRSPGAACSGPAARRNSFGVKPTTLASRIKAHGIVDVLSDERVIPRTEV